jgi:UPF0755 protein
MINAKKISIFTLSAFFLASFVFAYNFLCRPMHFTKKDKIVLVIEKNMSARAFVTTLKQKNLITYENFLLGYIRLFNLSKNLKSGVFEIQYNESVAHLLNRIKIFDVLKRKLQITPGITNSHLKKALLGAEYLHYDNSSWFKSLLNRKDLLEMCSNSPRYAKHVTPKPNAKYSEDCIKKLKNLDTLQSYEGLYLADTYQYNAGSDAENLLSAAHQNLKNCLFNSWEKRNLSLPYANPYDLLIVASILEKESANNEDRKLISGVILNRLIKNMPLQMDPTVIYGLQDKYSGKLSHNDMLIVTEYNTYKNKGLPPTPIAIVSCDSIGAASQPTLTDYLYFVANGKGSHTFSKTYTEHRRLIRQESRGN